MGKIRTGTVENLGEELLKYRTTKAREDPQIEAEIQRILRRVRTEGDTALYDFTEEFDGVNISPKGLRVSESDIASARSKTTPEDVKALEFLRKRIAKVERRRLSRANFTYKDSMIRMRQATRPLSSVGCYIPGGKAAYPSTVLMTVVPAKVAKVPRVVICSPPSRNGEIEPSVLVAADLCGVDEIYRVGGAHAIAAMAYGTESIRRVDKIVGPASSLVTRAKQMVSDEVAIDLPAGPSEILVLADETTDSRLAALDLISQAEHAPDNIPVLVSTSQRVLEETADEIGRILGGIERRQIVEEAFSKQGALLLARSTEEAIAFVNRFAPEHLEILASRPKTLAGKVASVGIILLGENATVAASDYCLGTNHVLPTMGSARTHSGLSVLDYVKSIPLVECRRSAIKRFLKTVKILSKSEGLPNHYLALEGRLQSD